MSLSGACYRYGRATSIAFVRQPTSLRCAREGRESHPGVTVMHLGHDNLSSSLWLAGGTREREDVDSPLITTVHCLDHHWGIMHSFSFCFGSGATVRNAYEAIRHFLLYDDDMLVFYAPAESRFGHVIRPCINRILSLDEPILAKMVCQRLLCPVSRFGAADVAKHWFVVVNVLVMSNSYEFSIGHLPVVLAARTNGVTRQQILYDLCLHLGLSETETAFVSELTVAPCRVCADGITLSEPVVAVHKDQDHVAILFPPIDVGDAVRVDQRVASLHDGGGAGSECCGKRPKGSYVAKQGTILRHNQVNGVRTFDVICFNDTTSSSVELCGLSCFHVVPL